MTFDFTKLLSDEAKQDLAEFERRRAEYANLTDENLVSTLKFCMGNCTEPAKYGRGECVYNATVWHLLIPEVVHRLERQNKER